MARATFQFENHGRAISASGFGAELLDVFSAPEFFDRMPDIVDDAIAAEAQLLGERSLEVTPMLTGALRDSQFIEEAGPSNWVVGYTESYAAAVHEIERENYTTPGTGPKYLERPAFELIAGMEARLALRVIDLIEAEVR